MPERSAFDSPNTLIVGASGRLGRAFAARWPLASRVSRAEMDITDRCAVLQALTGRRPKLVINCAALTDLAQCEREPDLAWAVNVRGVRHLAEGCRQAGAALVHFSSDAAVEPVNEYGWTKRASETLADLCLRAKIYDGSHWAWAALRQGRSVQLLTTEFLNPISTTSVASITEQVLQRGLRGLIDLGTRDRLSFWNVGRMWAKALGANVELVEPIEHLENSPPRPAELFLDPFALAAAGIAVPSLDEDARQHHDWYEALNPA